MLELLHKDFHVFLDNLTGDIFGYNKEVMEWQPVGNVGLHHSRTESSMQGGTQGAAGDLVKKIKVHKDSSMNSQKPIMIMTQDSDIKCDVRKNFCNHWLLDGVYHEFVCENMQAWDPHPVNITSIELVQKNYQTLAEGERGPQIAEHNNTIALQFSLKVRHTETIKILQNFIDNALTRVANQGKVGLPLMQAYDDLELKQKLKKSNLDFNTGRTFSQTHNTTQNLSSTLRETRTTMTDRNQSMEVQLMQQMESESEDAEAIEIHEGQITIE